MLASMLAADSCHLLTVSSDTLAGELVEQVRSEQPVAACIISLPPRGPAHARYLCKRLRASMPDLKLIVACPGLTLNLDRVRTRLQAAGADYVTTSLAETRGRILPLLRLQVHQEQASS
jgi:hypothetical protein